MARLEDDVSGRLGDDFSAALSEGGDDRGSTDVCQGLARGGAANGYFDLFQSVLGCNVDDVGDLWVEREPRHVRSA